MQKPTSCCNCRFGPHSINRSALRDIAVVEKYLRVHAEPEVALLRDWSGQMVLHPFHHCLVIPAYKETTVFVQRLLNSPLWDKRILAIIVINQPVDTPADNCNQQLADFFRSFPMQASGNLRLHQVRNSSFLIVDRYSPGRQIPVKQGVGAARKTGFDLAVYLQATGQIRSPVIYSSDADTILPDNYFSAPANCTSAVVFDFEHIASKDTDASVFHATQIYQSAIKYFRQGLQWAGSPYAYTSMGSAMAVHADAYCQVHGFPRRSGGEDFYLLNKLAKLAPVQYAPHICIGITARRSDRVPFGTGPAIQQILALDHPETDYHYYHPEIFHQLKLWLDFIPALWPAIKSGDSNWQLPEPALEALQDLGIQTLIRHLASNPATTAHGLRSTHQWFDAFRTLKFIRYLQSRHFAPLPLTACLQQASWL